MFIDSLSVPMIVQGPIGLQLGLNITFPLDLEWLGASWLVLCTLVYELHHIPEVAYGLLEAHISVTVRSCFEMCSIFNHMPGSLA